MKPVIKPRDPKDRDRDKVNDKDAKGSNKNSTQSKTAILLGQMSALNVSKPTNVEAQRILTIIEALIDKVVIAAHLDGEFMGNFGDSSKSKATEEFLQLLTEKTGKSLVKQGECENKLRPFLLASESQDKMNDPEKSENGGIDVTELCKFTRNNVRNLVRSLQDNPPDLDAIKMRKKSIWDEYEDFLNCLRSIRIIMLKKLGTSAEEENSHIKQIQELKERIKEYEKVKNTRELELQNMKKERQKYTAEKNEELNKLKAEIQEIKNKKKKEQDDSTLKSKGIIDANNKVYKDKETKAAEKLKALKEQLEEVKKKNKSEEENLKKKKQQREAGLKEAVESYDFVMDRKAVEKKEIEGEFERIKGELKDLKEYFKKSDEEKQKDAEIIEKIQIKKDLLETDDQRINQIVFSIQSAWRTAKAAKGGSKKKEEEAGKEVELKILYNAYFMLCY